MGRTRKDRLILRETRSLFLIWDRSLRMIILIRVLWGNRWSEVVRGIRKFEGGKFRFRMLVRVIQIWNFSRIWLNRERRVMFQRSRNLQFFWKSESWLLMMISIFTVKYQWYEFKIKSDYKSKSKISINFLISIFKLWKVKIRN